MAIGVGISGPRSGGGGGACTSRAWVRNPDWLDLPALSDGNNIIYVLNKVKEGVPNFFSFYSTLTSGTYEVDLYNDGTAVTTHSASSQADFDLDFLKGISKITEPNGDTYTQIITKISGNFNHPHFYAKHPDVSNTSNSPILSVKMASQTCTTLYQIFRGAANKVYHANLEEFEYVGTCNATSLLYSFHGAPNLGKVKGTFSSLTTMQQAFNASGDADFSEMELGSVSSMACTQAFISGRIREMFKVDFFKGASSTNATFQSAKIQYFGKASAPMQFNGLSGATGVYRLFYGCNRLKAAYFTSCAPESCEKTFFQNYVLETVSGIDGTNLTNTTGMFDQCYSLSTFESTNMAVSFSVEDCNFDRAGLVNIFNDLASATATITVTDNPGTGDLTAADLLIATNKGWTVTT